MKKYHEALEDINQYVNANPESEIVRLERIKIYQELGQQAKALEEIENLEENYPNSEQIKYQKAL